MGTEEFARNFAVYVVEAVRKDPGHKAAHYALRPKATEFLGEFKWPRPEYLISKSFQHARKTKLITCAADKTWWPTELPKCDHCGQVWLAKPTETSK